MTAKLFSMFLFLAALNAALYALFAGRLREAVFLACRPADSSDTG